MGASVAATYRGSTLAAAHGQHSNPRNLDQCDGAAACSCYEVVPLFAQ